MKFIMKCLPRSFFGRVPGVSTDDPLVILRSLLDASKWLLAYSIKLVHIDLKKAYDLITHRAIREAMKAWGMGNCKICAFVMECAHVALFCCRFERGKKF